LSYEDFLDNTVHFLKGMPSYRGEDSINYLYNSYRIDDYMHAFKDDLYRYEDIKEILLDENGKLKEINKDIYYKVLKIAKELEEYSNKQRELAHKQWEILIISADTPCNIKEFMSYSRHDRDILSISHDKNVLSFEFHSGFDRSEIYVFESSQIYCDIELSEVVKGFHIVDEEYYYNHDTKMYEYSALLRRRIGREDFHEIHELNFNFSKIISDTTRLRD